MTYPAGVFFLSAVLPTMLVFFPVCSVTYPAGVFFLPAVRCISIHPTALDPISSETYPAVADPVCHATITTLRLVPRVL